MNLGVDSGTRLAGDLSKFIQSRPSRAKIAVFPPDILIPEIDRVLDKRISLGGQDCHYENSGAYTGESSPRMLKEAGCEYVILGHSERRRYSGEKNTLVKLKAQAAIKAGLKPIICIGETLEQRQSGRAKSTVRSQIRASVPETSSAENSIIAYEPVWAIGTGVTPKLEEIQEMHDYMLSLLPLPALYGGSVKAENAGQILAVPSVGGLLVGGASLNLSEFCTIIGAAG